MPYRLTKATKQHIADMATRKKFQEGWNAAYKAFINSCATQLYENCEGKLFQGLPEKVLSACACACACACAYASSMRLCSDAADVKDLNDALSIGRDKLSSVSLGIKLYGYHSPSLSDVTDRSSFKSLLSTVNTIRDFRNTLLEAMESFRSGEKLIASLPCADEFYPQEDKTPTCKIVPVSVIEAANYLMGVGQGISSLSEQS